MIRAWKKEDIDGISKMEGRCFADPWSREMLEACLRYSHYHTFLIEEEGELCAYGCLICLFEDAEVANIAVDIPFRGKGLARALMQAMHAQAREKGAERCLLEVRQSNGAAIALYNSLGYAVYGRRARYYEDGEDALLMEKRL